MTTVILMVVVLQLAITGLHELSEAGICEQHAGNGAGRAHRPQ